ncbi:eukaryotic translation initiation factor 2 subunit 2-like [Gigantopelta aegis]|uniref:eukaryotic translation initiation factor 2 subunit 2-like n=1 Tax=Gigantopelta aegis TaxID=1735272 RepID=UPI001B88A899|nr:eukaryotic translation initiation factor 2 subunit 2-like [Gigantopelta aegis]
MAEDELLPFDPSVKKKKKKKKTPFDLAMVDIEAADGAPSVVGGDEPSTDGGAEKEKSDADVSLDFGGMKKKKKKKMPFNLDELAEALPDINEQILIPTMEDKENIAIGDEADEDFSLDFSAKKKKKKKKKVDFEEIVQEEDENEDVVDSVGDSMQSAKSWHGSDRDYTYDELLTRVFDIMREKNPDMIAGEKKKFVMRPPQVLRVGTRKSSFANFAEICRLLHRQPKHVLAFLLAELGTSGSVDGNNQLIIRGKYNQKQIENVLRRYIKEYVTCHTCRSPDTLLQKDTRLFFLQCETCGSRCSVASIKSGFQAVTSKRAAIRAKTA